MRRLQFRNWKFRCPRIAEFPFWIVAAIACLSVSASAQSIGELPELIKRNIHQLADSMFTANGESWSGTIWSQVPDFRRAGQPGVTNGFVLEEIEVEETSTSVDPMGKAFAIVSLRLRGNLLLKEGKIIPVEVERALDVLHDQQMTLSERYPELLRKDSSVWSNVIQPALVAIGAAAIIALFFFVRS
jgi:hypothetical protein